MLLIKRGVKAIPRKSAEIVLDFDATDDPAGVEAKVTKFLDFLLRYKNLIFTVVIALGILFNFAR